MSAKTKSWSDLEKSKIAELFESEESIVAKNPTLKRGRDADGSDKVSANDVATRVLACIDTVAKKRKSALLDGNLISPEDVTRLVKGLNGIKKVGTNVTAEFVKIKHDPRIRFWDSEIKNGKFYPPRMIVDLSSETIEPNESAMINTGYVVRIPMAVRAFSMSSGAIVKESAVSKQPPFVIVPIITCSTGHIVPSIYARDSADNGLLSINFTLISGKVGKLQIVFNAYLVDRSTMNGIALEDPEPNVTLFKPKDGLSGRLVKNPKVKIRYDQMTVDQTTGTVTFPTFNGLVSPTKTYEKQRVTIKTDDSVLVCSRRREWFDPSLLTLSGLISPTRKLAPKVLKIEDHAKNTHCLISLKSSVILFSEQVPTCPLHHLGLLNGAFVHLKDFAELSNNYKRMVFVLQSLAIGVPRCRALSQKLDIPFDKVLRVFDYHRNLNEATIRDYADLSDAELFASRMGGASAYSVVLHKSFANLLKWCDSLDNGDDVAATTTDEPVVDVEEPAKKKIKTEN